MNAVAVEEGGWTERRWFWSVLFFFFFQIGLIFYLADKEESPATPVARVPLHWNSYGGENGIYRGHAEAVVASDPTVFALPHAKGFSGEAWLGLHSFPYRMTNLIPSPRWLERDTGELAQDYKGWLDGTTVKRMPIFAEKPVPEFTAPRGQVAPVSLRLAVNLEGEASRHFQLAPPSMPLPELDAPVSNCVVRLAVTSTGEPFSPVILNSSGSEKLDREILKWVNEARFLRLPEHEVNWPGEADALVVGMLVFHWELGEHPAGSGP